MENSSEKITTIRLGFSLANSSDHKGDSNLLGT